MSGNKAIGLAMESPTECQMLVARYKQPVAAGRPHRGMQHSIRYHGALDCRYYWSTVQPQWGFQFCSSYSIMHIINKFSHSVFLINHPENLIGCFLSQDLPKTYSLQKLHNSLSVTL